MGLDSLSVFKKAVTNRTKQKDIDGYQVIYAEKLNLFFYFRRVYLVLNGENSNFGFFDSLAFGAKY